MTKKTFSIIDICVVLLYGIYLVTALFIDYPKYLRITFSVIYFLYVVMRAIYLIKNLKKTKND